MALKSPFLALKKKSYTFSKYITWFVIDIVLGV